MSKPLSDGLTVNVENKKKGTVLFSGAQPSSARWREDRFLFGFPAFFSDTRRELKILGVTFVFLASEWFLYQES